MTPEEREKTIAVLQRASVIANRHGKQIIDECGNSASVACTSAAIMLSTFAEAANMSMHDVMGLLMVVHKQTKSFSKESS